MPRERDDDFYASVVLAFLLLVAAAYLTAYIHAHSVTITNNTVKYDGKVINISRLVLRAPYRVVDDRLVAKIDWNYKDLYIDGESVCVACCPMMLCCKADLTLYIDSNIVTITVRKLSLSWNMTYKCLKGGRLRAVVYGGSLAASVASYLAAAGADVSLVYLNSSKLNMSSLVNTSGVLHILVIHGNEKTYWRKGSMLVVIAKSYIDAIEEIAKALNVTTPNGEPIPRDPSSALARYLFGGCTYPSLPVSIKSPLPERIVKTMCPANS